MQSISILNLTTQANGTLNKERFVGHNGATATAAGNAFGVAEFDAADAEDVTVNVIGTAVVVSGGVFAVGSAIQVGTDGKAIAQSAGVTVARALQASTGADERVEVILIQN